MIVAAGGGWFAASTLGSDDDGTALVTSERDGADDPDGRGGGAERSSTSASAPVVGGSGGDDSGSGAPDTSSTTEVSGGAAGSTGGGGPGTTTQRTTPATSPPATAPPTTVPSLSFNHGYSFSDPDRRVMLALPDVFGVDRSFDGSSARWSGGGVVAYYEVVGASGVATADARISELRASRTIAGYESVNNDKRPLDGRYVVSGMRGDGTYFYERGKIRCGYLARYRLEWTGGEKHPTADAIANTWYDDDPDLDAMGGVHAVC